ncbi:MAG: metalloregulator ArsR/SmtB family transcription factor [Candidatus Paceibacterota bacterium]|jgi:ArsR family transcriptional regulator
MKMKCCQDKQGKKEIAQTAAILKLLAEENRLKIICILKDGEHCVCEIIKHLGLPQNLVSHHLNKLKKAELIQGNKNGTWVHYSLTDKGKKVAENVFKIN